MNKTLLIFSILVFSLNTYSQDRFLNFKIVNETNIIWQNIYDTDLSKNEIVDYFKLFGNIKIVEETNDRIIGYSYGGKIDFNKYKGSKIGNTIFDNDLFYKVIIDLKDKKYRFTTLDILFSKDGGMLIDGWGSTGAKHETIDNKYIKEGRFKSSFSREGAESLNKYFLDSFLAKKLLDDF